MTIDKNKVLKSYNGQQGCMCGCLGNYSYAPDTPREDWQGKVSTRGISRAVNKLNSEINWDAPEAEFYQEGFSGEHIYFLDHGERTTVVYASEKFH